MNKRFEQRPMYHIHTPAPCFGQSLGEYVLIAGIMLAVCIPALMLLGGSVNTIFTNILSTPRPKPNTPTSIAAAPSTNESLQSSSSAKAPSGFYKGTGYYAVMLDPVTGKPVITSAKTSQIDVAGSNGNLNTLGTTILAKKLEQLAQQQTDPQLKDYYGQMAELSYYLGAAEGELDDVSGLAFSEKQYTNGDALQDINNYHQTLLSMMQNPPANTNPQQLQEVLPLATEVFNIAHNYVNNLSQFIDASGKVSKSFDVNGGGSGSGDPGSVLTQTTDLSVHGGIIGKSIEQVVAYDQVKKMAVEFLADHKVASTSISVKITLNGAQDIDTHSSSNQKED